MCIYTMHVHNLSLNSLKLGLTHQDTVSGFIALFAIRGHDDLSTKFVSCKLAQHFYTVTSAS